MNDNYNIDNNLEKNDTYCEYDDYEDFDYDKIELPQKKKKKQLPKWVKVILIILGILFAIILFVILFIDHQLNKIGRVPANTATISPSDEYFETDSPIDNEGNPLEEVDPDTIIWDEATQTISDKNIINILLIGQDRRPGEIRARSDSMIIVSIDKKNNSLKMTSILRDMYVQIPGYSDNRINASYAWGGMNLLDETIKKNFGIIINKNIEVDFTAFTKIIDEIEGIDVAITSKEADYLCNQGFYVREGTTHMDGELALAYSRIRYIDSDFGRANRQRIIISSIFNKVKDDKLTKWYSLSNKIFPLLTTDMTNSEIVNYVYDIYNLKISSLESYRIPDDNTYENKYIRKMAVLVPDLAANRSYLYKKIYGKD